MVIWHTQLDKLLTECLHHWWWSTQKDVFTLNIANFLLDLVSGNHAHLIGCPGENPEVFVVCFDSLTYDIEVDQLWLCFAAIKHIDLAVWRHLE